MRQSRYWMPKLTAERRGALLLAMTAGAFNAGEKRAYLLRAKKSGAEYIHIRAAGFRRSGYFFLKWSMPHVRSPALPAFTQWSSPIIMVLMYSRLETRVTAS